MSVALQHKEDFDAVLKAACAGDGAAWFELIQAYGPYIEVIAARVLKAHPECDLEEAVWRIWFQVYRSLRGQATFRGASAFTTWLYPIARRTCGRYVRQRRELSFVDASRTQEEFPIMEKTWSGRSPPDECEADEVVRLVRAAIAMLTARARQMLEMDMARFSDEQIAERLEVDVKTVKSTLYRARKQLRKVLQSYVEDGSTELLRRTWLDGRNR